jgi:hypothetical protein
MQTRQMKQAGPQLLERVRTGVTEGVQEDDEAGGNARRRHNERALSDVPPPLPLQQVGGQGHACQHCRREAEAAG